jgi:hypothetical protein
LGLRGITVLAASGDTGLLTTTGHEKNGTSLDGTKMVVERWENHGKTMGKPWENHGLQISNGF